MNELELKDLEILALAMGWEDLVEIMLHIESRISKLSRSMSEKELKDLTIEYAIYEYAKAKLIKDHSTPFIKRYLDDDIDYLSYENDEEDFY